MPLLMKVSSRQRGLSTQTKPHNNGMNAELLFARFQVEDRPRRPGYAKRHVHRTILVQSSAPEPRSLLFRQWTALFFLAGKLFRWQARK